MPGDLDPSFSGDGRQTTDFGRNEFGAATVIQPDGKVVVAGVTDSPDTGLDIAVARYAPNGSLDPTFSGDGRVTFELPDASSSADDVALQGDKIVIVGSYRGPDNGNDGDFLAMRLNADGSPDTSFSGDGRTLVDFGNPNDFGRGIAVDAAGRLVLAGQTDNGRGGSEAVRDFAVARLTPAGNLDATFSGDGRQTVDFGGDRDAADAVAIQADGRIVAAGEVQAPSLDAEFALVRLTDAGELDPTFAGDGRQSTDLRGDDSASDLAIAGDGRIVAAGRADNSSGSADFAAARYRPDGTLDPTFSGDGKQTVDFGGFDGASGVALQGDGRAVLAGSSDLGTDFEREVFAVARLRADGGLDSSFSGDGKVTTSFPRSEEDGASDVAIQSNGRIVAVGGTSPGEDGDFALARYLATSSPSPPPGPTRCTIDGTSGADVIRGTPGDDVICAGRGNDVVRGEGGDDTILGGPGNDVLRGGSGADRLHGEADNDTLNTSDGRRANDRGDGGAGSDACSGDPRDALASC
jgi:uncharacterized delta-60 repeat protein